MSKLTVYSSEPSTFKMALAFFGLSRLGLEVELKPLSALVQTVVSGPRPGRRLSVLTAKLEEVTLQLVEIGEKLEAHQNGALLLQAGEENGLYAERDALVSRKRGIERHLQAVKAEQGNG